MTRIHRRWGAEQIIRGRNEGGSLRGNLVDVWRVCANSDAADKLRVQVSIRAPRQVLVELPAR